MSQCPPEAQLKDLKVMLGEWMIRTTHPSQLSNDEGWVVSRTMMSL
jgi:hypothetical protein